VIANWRLPVPVRKARLQDAEKVHALVNSLSNDGTLLPRPFAEICENIRDFTVAESNGGEFQGCGALHLYGPHLAEVRSIVVQPEWKGCGRRVLSERRLLCRGRPRCPARQDL
jgi:amino-acid N-acetyltransferase